MSCQLAKSGEGGNPKIDFKHNLGNDVYENLDDLIELYFYVLDAAGNTLARYSKSGNDILGNPCIELIRKSAYWYRAVLTSALTKTLGSQQLQGELNPVRADSELATGISNTPIRFTWLNNFTTNIKEVT